jgi:hypothetical protein
VKYRLLTCALVHGSGGGVGVGLGDGEADGDADELGDGEGDGEVTADGFGLAPLAGGAEGIDVGGGLLGVGVGGGVGVGLGVGATKLTSRTATRFSVELVAAAVVVPPDDVLPSDVVPSPVAAVSASSPALNVNLEPWR